MLIVAALSGLALVCAQEPNFTPAEEVEENPAGVTYQAILPESAKSSVRGYVAGTSAPDGNGVNFNVNIYGLPDASLGPFSKQPLVVECERICQSRSDNVL